MQERSDALQQSRSPSLIESFDIPVTIFEGFLKRERGGRVVLVVRMHKLLRLKEIGDEVHKY